MSNEIIKVIDHITKNPFIHGYVIVSAALALGVLVVVALVFRKIFKEYKRTEREFDQEWRQIR